jgi:rod shape-determining protein MreD
MAAVTVQPPSPLVWLIAPALMCAAASVVLATPIEVFGLQLPEPVFAMAPAFAWAGLRPSVAPPFVLLALGLFLDVLWGAPLGLWPLCLLSLYGVAFAVRPILSGQGFWALAAWYGASSAVGFAAGLMLTLAISGQTPSLVGVALQWGVTVTLFPLARRLIEYFEDADVRFR